MATDNKYLNLKGATDLYNDLRQRVEGSSGGGSVTPEVINPMIEAYLKEHSRVEPVIRNRNLMEVLGASSVQDCFDRVRRLYPWEYSKLALGDYIDIPKWTVSGASETTTDTNFRFQVAGFNHYGPDSGILFESVNIPFTRVMTDNKINTTAGYEGSDLRKLINNTFAPKLKEYTGAIKPISRVLDKNQCNEFSTVVDEVYVPNYTELFGDLSFSGYTGTGATESRKNSKQFQIHSVGDKDSRTKTYNGSARFYWTSSTNLNNTSFFCTCSGSGNSSVSYANSSSNCGVVVAFNI